MIKALGTNVVPNLNGEGRFLQGSNTAGNKVEAGLPNIEGDWSCRWNAGSVGFIIDGNGGSHVRGCYKLFKHNYGRARVYNEELSSMPDSEVERYYGYPVVDASLSSPVYGRSSTVQPPAYTVKYYICYGE